MTHTFRAATLLTALLLLFSWVPRSQALAEETQEYRSGDYRYILREDGIASITKYTGRGGDVAVPETLDEHQVMAIGDRAFMWSGRLTSLTLSEGLESIGDEAFSHCGRLTSLTLPEGLVSIGDSAFSRCSRLTSLTLPDSLVEIGTNPFVDTPARIELSPDQSRFALIDGVLFDKEGRKLIAYPSGRSNKAYSVPKNVRTIGDSAFRENNYITSLTLPKGLMSIGDSAFYNCKNLISLALRDGLVSIGDKAFYNCVSLASLTLPKGLVSIGDIAFFNCASLTALILPDSLMEIGANLFSGTPARIKLSPEQSRFALIDGVLFDKEEKKLMTYPYGESEKEYSVPKGIRAIGDYAFYKCNNLISLTLPKGLESIGDIAFYNCASLTSLTLPEGLVNIGNYAFADCESLTSLTLPEGLVSIGFYAFASCKNIQSIIIPASVSTIVAKAFHNCPKLTLIVERDSYTAAWAKENDVPYQYPDALDWLND